MVGPVALIFLRAFAWAYAIQPRFLRLFWGDFLGRILRALNLRGKVIRDNLARAYPGDAEAQERLYREAYRHLGRLSLDFMFVFGPMPRFVRREAVLEGADHWRKAHEAGNGVIFLSSHVGNWEIMGATGGLLGGMDLLFVTKHLKPEWLHQAVEKGRRLGNVRGTYEPRTLKDVLRDLGKGGTVGIVLDQYMGPPIGVRVPFFGIPVGTSSAIAMLAKRTGAAVLPVTNYRAPDGKVHVVIRAPLEWIPRENPDEEIAVNTAYYSEIVEKDVREHPEQWLWTHRRFKGDLTPLRQGEWREGRARK